MPVLFRIAPASYALRALSAVLDTAAFFLFVLLLVFLAGLLRTKKENETAKRPSGKTPEGRFL